MIGAPPLITAIAQPWWDALARREVVLQRCDDCHAWVFYPRPFCPGCGSRSLTWTPVSGHATLYSWSVARVPVAPAFAAFGTSIVAIAEFSVGVRVPTTLVETEPAALRIGMALTPVFDSETYAGVTLLRFRPADTGSDV